MSDTALYFPHVNLPDDAWVKAAALHWPQLGRIHPRGYYGLRESDTVRRLREEADFIVDVRPGWGAGRREPWVDEDVLRRVDPVYFEHRLTGTEDQVDALFYDFLDRHRDALLPRYGIEALAPVRHQPARGEVYDELQPLDPRLAKVHPAKMSYRLARRLADAGLLFARSYQWRRASDSRVLDVSDLAMHRDLGRVYLAVLADVVARENAMTPLTDQPLMCAVTSGWTVETLADLLLADGDGDDDGDGADAGQVFALLALRTVLPRDLAEVPVDRIIEARRRLLPELLDFRAFLDELAPDLVEISALPDPEVRAAKLRNRVEREITGPIERMENEIGRLGLQPARAVLTLQTLAPPAALGVLAEVARVPSVLTGAGVAAGCLVGAASSALDQRRQALAGHPTGYLLSLRGELGPSEVVARVRSAVRRAAPGRRRRRR
ncbi:hypothetical protein FH609_006230 [Streptomyces sp. 3MP-14]|uniref:Uncharacterized protein n=1 Tax=Streptomyces mimosae TaxID=2586635 RepID=A0A5N6ANQ7_9ACTN|nr:MULTISPECIES: DUF6236 family protein [Streptomyces]KAB8169865.1 hypothetical protein FH607_003910 [Streptomyces mimosae]KAB8178613.1 hypothetical protein FH609_006230 [Streptomyces sp. 3MP-14]